MSNQTYKDIVLTEQDLEEINEVVATRDDLDAHSKGVLRDMMKRDAKEGIWSNRDYVYGQDEGEPYKGDVRN